MVREKKRFHVERFLFLFGHTCRWTRPPTISLWLSITVCLTCFLQPSPPSSLSICVFLSIPNSSKRFQTRHIGQTSLNVYNPSDWQDAVYYFLLFKKKDSSKHIISKRQKQTAALIYFWIQFNCKLLMYTKYFENHCMI